MFEVGGWYLTGCDDQPNQFQLPSSHSLAHEWISKAAQQHMPKAMFAMGYFHEQGIGCNKNMEMAVYWYGMSANAGDGKAKSWFRDHPDWSQCKNDIVKQMEQVHALPEQKDERRFKRLDCSIM